MRRPGTALASAAATAGVAAAAVALSAGGAAADLGVPVPSVTTISVPLPSVSVPPLPLPTSTPVPSVSVPGVPLPSASVPGGGEGSGNGTGTSGSGSGPTGTAASGSGNSAPGTAAGTAGTAGTAAQRRQQKRKTDATPMIAGTDRARDLVDDESSPQLLRASQQFLAADEGIAEIARQKQVMARLKQDAAATAQLYRAMGYDVAGAQRAAASWHEQYDALPPDATAGDLLRVGDSATRADERLGDLIVAREGVKADFARIAGRYESAKRQLADANARVTVLAAQRSSALSAVQAAKGSDVALNQARLAESGRLGAQIESLSEQLARRGATVDGTGSLIHPLDGVITSPFGMRFHPILHHTKLHSGTDFAGASVIKAADDGRVLMTVLSTAYGSFTVIDHGIVDGTHLTTAYAHQARFLVEPGDVVRKGDPIGIVGQSGYATGPHLHFEVREDGTVVDPVAFLARH
jgi:murein DD-endopeptidase MepM/ murein hydrolase activator NlpD